MDIVSECLAEAAIDEGYEGWIGFGFAIESIFQTCEKLDYELNITAGHIVGYVIRVAMAVLADVFNIGRCRAKIEFAIVSIASVAVAFL